MRHLASVGLIEGVKSVAAEAACELGLEAQVEAFLSAVSRNLVSEY